MQALELWNSYKNIHQACPDPFGAMKLDFYIQNSKNIQQHNRNTNPQMAIIIAAHNETALLGRTLASINNALLQVPYCTKTIVVDNDSSDGSAEVSKTFGAEVVRESKKGVGYARQAGIEATLPGVKFILTTDADAVVPPDWICKHSTNLENQDVVCSYGESKRYADFKTRRLTEYALRAFDFGAGYMHSARRFMGTKITGAGNMAFRRDVVLEIGGYSKDLACGEDRDLSMRLSDFGEVSFIDCPVLVSARRILMRGIGRTILERILGNMHDPLLKETAKLTFADYREPSIPNIVYSKASNLLIKDSSSSY